MKSVLTKENAGELFTRLDQKPIGNGETFLIYGGTGTGKTEFCGTAGDRTLFLNIGNGLKTIQSPGFKLRHKSNPIVIDIKEKTNSYGVFEEARAYDMVCDSIDYALSNFSDDFDFVVLDDAASFNNAALNKGIESNALSGKSKTLSEIRRTNVMSAAIQDYGAEMNLVEQFLFGTVNLLKDSNKHFVMTAHLRETFVKGDKIGELPKLHSVRPGFTGQTFPDVVPGFFDNVFLMQCVGGGNKAVYRATTAGDEIRYAKTRHSGLFDTVETNPNLLKFIERIRSGKR